LWFELTEKILPINTSDRINVVYFKPAEEKIDTVIYIKRRYVMNLVLKRVFT
jgi:hypothetical protein